MKNTICQKNQHYVLFILSLFPLWLKVTIGTDYKCIDKERHALLDFKAYIHHDPKGLVSTWIAGEEATTYCCNWSGVICNNQTGHVTGISLENGHLRGEISPSLLNLTYLNHLELEGNFFKGTIPKFIGSMNELRYLDLSSNNFTGIIPPELGNLTNLQVLLLEYLEGCTLKSLDWLSHLSYLKTLSIRGISLAKVNHWVNVILSLQKLSSLALDGCDLSQVMHPYSYSSFNSSSSIATLYLANNNLNSSMYHWLFPLTSNKLEVLDLSVNKLDWIPKYIGNLCNLGSFQCLNNLMQVNFPDFISNFTGCASATLQNLLADGNQLTGSLPDDIQKFSSLDTLYLGHNKLNGTISEKVWQLPKLRFLDVSFNSLKFTIAENNGKSNISKIDLSKSSLVYLGLSSSIIGHAFPKWVQRLKKLVFLDISNTGISDTIPLEFWNMWHSQLIYLSLSSNNISGKVTDLQSNFEDASSIIDLSSNNFYGPIPKVPSYVQILDLSKNKFYGGIHFLCEIADGSFLTSLDLSNNSLTGPIPDCLWHFRELQVLNLGQNSFSGGLPATIEYLINLEALYLHNNNFSGELPISLQNCTKLTFLHLGANNFSGYVPAWLGEKLSSLYVLSLKSNNFFGTIPLEICQLVNIQILDMSMNNFFGTIPSCLNNLTTLIQVGSSFDQNVHHYSFVTYISGYVDHVMIQWQGSVREFSSTLGLVKSIDLSCNNLVGKIPPELTVLHELITMNLSNNALFGEIPQKIGDMKKLLALDLSRNNLTGKIPSSMSQMTSLNYLDVSHNNLHGRIPSSTQLQSFAPSRYIENLGLCGPPLTKYCPGDKEPHVQPHVDQNEDDLQGWFYIGGATGFATGIWIACGSLLVSRRGRNAFFSLS